MLNRNSQFHTANNFIKKMCYYRSLVQVADPSNNTAKLSVTRFTRLMPFPTLKYIILRETRLKNTNSLPLLRKYLLSFRFSQESYSFIARPFLRLPFLGIWLVEANSFQLEKTSDNQELNIEGKDLRCRIETLKDQESWGENFEFSIIKASTSSITIKINNLRSQLSLVAGTQFKDTMIIRKENPEARLIIPMYVQNYRAFETNITDLDDFSQKSKRYALCTLKVQDMKAHRKSFLETICGLTDHETTSFEEPLISA